MCVVSMVTDYYNDIWPKRWPSNPRPWEQDEELKKQLKEVLERLDQIDKKLKDKDCKDEKKKKFIKALGANIDG